MQSVCWAACEYSGMTDVAMQEVTICLLLFLMFGRRTNCGRWKPGTAHAAGQTQGAGKKFQQHIFCE